jgi:uncharacterized phage protein (TIGR02218 family)
MLDLPQPLADHLASGSTSLCRCWRLIRRDGATMGFTDHDRDLVFNGVTFQAASGFEASEAEARLGLSVGGAEVAGALSSAAISEADIAAGRYDGASLETWLVNWADVSQRALLDLSSIGEIRREDGAFAAELRSAAAIYDEEKGRLFTRACDAAFGDARCGAPLSGTNRIATTITGAAANDRLTIATIPGLPAGWFSLGRIEFTSGAATGFVADIATHGAEPARRGGIRHRRRGCADRRLRQELRDLPRPFRQCAQFPRLPAYPLGRPGAGLCRARTRQA